MISIAAVTASTMKASSAKYRLSPCVAVMLTKTGGIASIFHVMFWNSHLRLPNSSPPLTPCFARPSLGTAQGDSRFTDSRME